MALTGMSWAWTGHLWYRPYLPRSRKKQQKIQFILEAQFKFEKIFFYLLIFKGNITIITRS